jgi:hypothetical protein
MENNGTATVNRTQGQLQETAPTEPTKTPAKRVRKYPPKPTDFRLEVVIGEDRYVISPVVGANPEVALIAWRFKKTTGKQLKLHYVHLTPQRQWECDCEGFERWGMRANGGKGCRHVRVAVALVNACKEAPHAR